MHISRATFSWPFFLLTLTTACALSVIANAEAADTEDYSAHLQATLNWQKHPGFSAAYTGPNSLLTNAEEMYTFSTTAFLGLRPWQGGELYYNPEIAEGVPFSTNLVGLGGYTNGEITRAGGTTPILYRQRLFLRQTWNNGGGSETLEAGLNQLAGSQDKNRIVLTAGNFSTLDVFDPNSYAKDPRTQFMNWGNWTYAAFDYAADARGFGWGVAAEWYQGSWAVRVARMTGPTEPNLLPVDFALDVHYGDQLEVEHAHTLFARPGKLRVLAWHNRAKLATFNDALIWLKANPGNYTGPDALYAARHTEQDKYGVGFNVEQELSDNLGFFLRVMQADGRTETHAFTEVDGSFSTGLSFKGSAWGRGEDTFGIGLSENTISSERKRFLQAGGISFFIGDSALHYRPEQIFESYYSLQLHKFTWLTPDYQFITNPAYNADRGPIHVFAVRLHAEF
ncbi:MAG: carbohydrate porin [Gallionellaceae bacterium]